MHMQGLGEMTTADPVTLLRPSRRWMNRKTAAPGDRSAPRIPSPGATVSPASDDEQAFRDLKALLEQRIAESRNGDVVVRSLAEIAEDALKSGGRA